MSTKTNVTVTAIDSVDEGTITFSDGTALYSYHSSDCCESHYLSMKDLSLSDFDGLEFDLSNDNFFERIEGYGIALKPVTGHPVRIPGYGYNNGYYSNQLNLILMRDGQEIFDFNITECQEENDG